MDESNCLPLIAPIFSAVFLVCFNVYKYYFPRNNNDDENPPAIRRNSSMYEYIVSRIRRTRTGDSNDETKSNVQ